MPEHQLRREQEHVGPRERLSSLPRLSAAGCGLVLYSPMSQHQLGTLGKLNPCSSKRPVQSPTLCVAEVWAGWTSR